MNEEDKGANMDWIQALTVMGVLGGFLVYHANRVDNQIIALNQRIEGINQRLDQLYGMFIDLLKEGKK